MSTAEQAQEGLICAYRLDGQGGGVALGWKDINNLVTSSSTPAWVHLDYVTDSAQEWLRNKANIHHLVCESFLAEDTRPRSVMTENGLLVILRAVNMNPGAEPDDMVSLRMLISAERIITLRHRKVTAINDLREDLEEGYGPTGAGDFLAKLAGRMVFRMADVLSNMDDLVDDLEDSVLTMHSRELRPKLSDVRRQIIRMRRYLAPQRDTLLQLQNERVDWMLELDRIHLREMCDRTTRYVEDLDAARDRAAVTQEELTSLLAERMEKTMYVLSIVGAIFLPLGLLTGLLGINVGGMPGVDDPMAFTWVCVILVVLAMLEVWLLKRKNWF